MAALVTVGTLRLLLLFRNRLPQDRPNERSLHAGAIPRIGGLAIWAGGGVAVGLGVSVRGGDADLLPVLLAATALALLSFLDDCKSLPAGLRMIAHLAAAAWVVGAMASLPMGIMAIAVLGVAWMTNLYNFMDGADGLAAGMAVIGFSAYGLGAIAWSPSFAMLSFVIAAAAAGFLIFNFNPARAFMGDAGSIPLGFLAGALGLSAWQQGAWPAWFPVLVFSPFIVDASVTLVRRVLRGARVWEAHREHYYQRLIRLGWSHRRTALMAYGVMLAAAASALLLLKHDEAAQWAGVAAWGAAYAAIAWHVDRQWRLGHE